MSNIHPLRIQDIFRAGQLIEKGIFFDTSLNLTAGNLIFEHLIRLGKGELFPFIHETDNSTALATLNFPAGFKLARLAHISPSVIEGANKDDFVDLLNRITSVAGEMGAFSLAAEVDTDSDELELLRRGNFAIYSRQDIWFRPPSSIADYKERLVFIPPDERDYAFRMYDQHLPALMRGCDPTVLGATLIYRAYEKSDVSALVFIFSGASASLLDVMILDHATDKHEIMLNALSLVGGFYRTVYLRNRTFAGLSDNLIEDLGFVRQNEQVLMIKHIASRTKQDLDRKALAIDNGAIPTVPSTHRSE